MNARLRDHRENGSGLESDLTYALETQQQLPISATDFFAC
jgi:hypothetical protein